MWNRTSALSRRFPYLIWRLRVPFAPRRHAVVRVYSPILLAIPSTQKREPPKNCAFCIFGGGHGASNGKMPLFVGPIRSADELLTGGEPRQSFIVILSSFGLVFIWSYCRG